MLHWWRISDLEGRFCNPKEMLIIDFVHSEPFSILESLCNSCSLKVLQVGGCTTVGCRFIVFVDRLFENDIFALRSSSRNRL
jgi:hypothetical protein